MSDLHPLPQRFLEEARHNLIKGMREDLSSVLGEPDTARGLLEASIDEMVLAELEVKIRSSRRTIE
jgi:hypothetical protein